MNKDLKNLLQLVIKAGIEQGILGGSSRVCRKQKVKVRKENFLTKNDAIEADVRKGE